jgi:hypothetical protein
VVCFPCPHRIESRSLFLPPVSASPWTTTTGRPRRFPRPALACRTCAARTAVASAASSSGRSDATCWLRRVAPDSSAGAGACVHACEKTGRDEPGSDPERPCQAQAPLARSSAAVPRAYLQGAPTSSCQKILADREINRGSVMTRVPQ